MEKEMKVISSVSPKADRKGGGGGGGGEAPFQNFVRLLPWFCAIVLCS